MKRLSTVILFVFSLLSTSILPTSAAPDYSNLELPALNSVNFKVIVNSATSITFRLSMNITQKANKVKSVTYRVFVPPKNPLEPPCSFAGNGYLNAGGVPQVVNNSGDIVVETTFTDITVCKGIYGLGESNGGGAELRLIDEADHYVFYATLYGSGKNVKGSNLWIVESVPKPNCPIWWRGNDYWGYDVCNETLNLKSIVMSSIYEATSDILAAQTKAAAELKTKLDADAKAAAELKAKQEADAKAAAELKAKLEAEAKAATDLKAKQEADAKAAAELKAKQDAAADKAALASAQSELAAANAALADAQKVNREQAGRITSFEEQFKVLSESVATVQNQLSQLNSKLVAALSGLNTANAKIKKICAAKPKPKGC